MLSGIDGTGDSAAGASADAADGRSSASLLLPPLLCEGAGIDAGPELDAAWIGASIGREAGTPIVVDGTSGAGTGDVACS